MRITSRIGPAVGVVLLVALPALAPVVAQPQAYVGYTWDRTVGTTVFEFTETGTVLSTLAVVNPNVSWFTRLLVQDEYNRGYYLLGMTGIFHLDAANRLTTVVSNPGFTAPFGIVRDGDGRWLVLENTVPPNPIGVQVYEIRGGKLVPLCVALSLYGATAAMHPEGGDILVRGFSKSSPGDAGFYVIDPRTGHWSRRSTTFGGFSFTGGACEPIYHAGHDAFLDIHFTVLGVGEVLWARQHRGLARLTTIGTGYRPYDVVRAGGRPPAAPYRVVAEQSGRASIFDLDDQGNATRLGTLPNQTGVATTRCMLPRASRHLSWFMNQAPHDRTLRVSFPQEANRGYVVALTLSGVRPGVALNAGRVIPLNPDGLTALCISGGLAGVISGTVGKLDAGGNASVRVNLTSVAAFLKRARVAAVAVVLDPRSAHAIARIAGPTGFSVP